MSAQNPATDRLTPSAERSIASLLENLSEIERERLAVDVIQQNRRYLKHAQNLFERLEEAPLDNDGHAAGIELRHEYNLSLIILSGHHKVVSAVIDALGYVPDVSKETTRDDGALGR